MLTEYKIWYIRRLDNTHIDECAVRFYEGEFEVVLVKDVLTGEMKKVQQFKRVALTEDELPHFSGEEFKKQVSGRDTVIFTSDDFGKITTDGELHSFLKTQLAKDKTREPVAWLKIKKV